MVELARPRLVVAEDDDAILDLIRTRLELAGYAISYARDGYAALDMIKAIQPVGLVLDLNMPRLDGFGVLDALRSPRFQKPPPVLVLTARHATEDVRRCLALGAKDYLAKPFQDRDLIARVARLLRSSASRPPVSAAAPKDEDAYILLDP